MEFDNDAKEFVLEPQDFSVLKVPQELGRWPMRDVDHLVEEMDMVQVRLDTMDETQFPLGSGRLQMQALEREQRAILGQMRKIVAEHICIDDSELDTFFEK